MDKPDTISVVVNRREAVRASQADITFTAKATSLITTDAALRKVKEVTQVLGQLLAIGVKESDVTLLGIHAERNTPIIGPSNTASYSLRLHCPDLERLPDLLNTLTAQRNVVLDQLDWIFPDDAHVHAGWLDAALAEARDKAQRIASALGVKLLAVHSCVETWRDAGDDEKRFLFASARPATGPKLGGERSIELSFPLITTKHVELQLEVHFRVSGYA